MRKRYNLIHLSSDQEAFLLYLLLVESGKKSWNQKLLKTSKISLVGTRKNQWSHQKKQFHLRLHLKTTRLCSRSALNLQFRVHSSNLQLWFRVHSSFLQLWNQVCKCLLQFNSVTMFSKYLKARPQFKWLPISRWLWVRSRWNLRCWVFSNFTRRPKPLRTKPCARSYQMWRSRRWALTKDHYLHPVCIHQILRNSWPKSLLRQRSRRRGSNYQLKAISLRDPSRLQLLQLLWPKLTKYPPLNPQLKPCARSRMNKEWVEVQIVASPTETVPVALQTQV